MSCVGTTVCGGRREGMTVMRALGKQFVRDLATGILAPVTHAVHEDQTLCLELRGAAINVYYRGCSLMKITETSTGYQAGFDWNWWPNDGTRTRPTIDLGPESLGAWLREWPHLKWAIDRSIARKAGRDEREVQQWIVRANNYGRLAPTDGQGCTYRPGSIARSTDIYICDVEYTRSGEPWRFDMIGVHWPSVAHQRRQARGRRLVIVEVKCGDGALGGAAGLAKHIRDIDSALARPDMVAALKQDMVCVFNQKRQLGLMDCGMDLAGFSTDQPLLLLVLVNHDPDSARLQDGLANLPETPHVDLCLGTACFFGYGLYDQGLHTVGEFREHFGRAIYKGHRHPKE